MRILVSTQAMLLGAAEPLLLLGWTGAPPTTLDAKRASAAHLPVAKAVGERKAAMVVLIPPGMPLPDPTTRDALASEIIKILPYLAAGVSIASERGLRGVAVRAAISTMQLVTRVGHPERVVATIPEAAAFLHAELRKRGSTPSLAELSAEITAFDVELRAKS